MIETWVTAIVITWVLKHWVEKGKQEYAHTRDTHAAEIARAHPDWSERRIQRHARRRARGYWWDQIRRDFPDLKAAYEEDRLIAEHERIRAELDGVKRRKELRDRIREALEENQRIAEQERAEEEARRATKAKDPATVPGPAKPESAPEPTPEPEPEAAKTVPEPAPGAATQPEPATDDNAKTIPVVDAEVLPFRRPAGPTPVPTPSGEEMTDIPTGEYTGYEAAVNDWDAMTEVLADVNRFFETRMSEYRRLNIDDETVEQANHCKTKAEELATAIEEASKDWVDRHGSVKERKDATSTSGDHDAYV